MANPNYTPVDVTAMVDALSSIGAVRDLPAMVGEAAAADSRPTAFFVRRRIELTAAWRRRHGPIAAFAGADSVRFPLAETADGAIVGVYPIDILSWTPETARTLDAMTAEAQRSGAASKTLVITGTATPLAKSRLAALGWTVQERAKF